MSNDFLERPVFLEKNGKHRYSLKIPTFMAQHANYDHWEKDRLASIEANVHLGLVLFDVGAELGWLSVILARLVGAEKTCLFESVPEVWPNILEIWEANNLSEPLATYCGFVSHRTTGVTIGCRSWPIQVQNPPLRNFATWGHLHSEPLGQQIRLDDFVRETSIVPDVMNVDVEGAEAWVLEGAEKILREHRPLLWVSIHPDERLRKYGRSKQHINIYMKALDYQSQYLGVDHEEHYFFYPRERHAELTFVESPWGSQTNRGLNFEEANPGWLDTMPERGQYWMSADR